MLTITMRYSDMILFAAINSTVYLGLKALYARIWSGDRNGQARTGDYLEDR